jgi:hypothetical protein
MLEGKLRALGQAEKRESRMEQLTPDWDQYVGLEVSGQCHLQRVAVVDDDGAAQLAVGEG